jgi:hypothetical protein
MAALSIKSPNFVPQKMKVMVVPLGLFLAALLLGAIVVRVGLSRVSSQRAELQKASKNETILAQKQNVLQALEEDVLSYADTAILAVPEKNPSLIALSQLKILGESKGLLIDNIEIGNSVKDKSGGYKAIVSFEVEGAFDQVLSYLTSIKTFAPLTIIDRAEITQAGGAVRASVDAVVYWASLPTKLPALSEPVKELSASETNIITELSTLEPPLFTEVLPSAPSGRLDPFVY